MNEIKQKRLDFAKRQATNIEEMNREMNWEAWKLAAKEAKRLGLYSKTTFVGDIARSMQNMAKNS